MDTFIFSGLLWPPQPRRSDGKPQILMWILMWKKGKNLVYLYVKLSILSIGGPRLIFMNSNKCPTMWLIKKWDVALSSRFVWRYSFSQLSIRNLGYLDFTINDLTSAWQLYLMKALWLSDHCSYQADVKLSQTFKLCHLLRRSLHMNNF